MNDPDGMVQTIREQEKHIADLELRLKLRDKRISWWQDPFGSITATVARFEEATQYEPQ
jgi:hypothetical protein